MSIKTKQMNGSMAHKKAMTLSDYLYVPSNQAESMSSNLLSTLGDSRMSPERGMSAYAIQKPSDPFLTHFKKVEAFSPLSNSHPVGKLKNFFNQLPLQKIESHRKGKTFVSEHNEYYINNPLSFRSTTKKQSESGHLSDRTKFSNLKFVRQYNESKTDVQKAFQKYSKIRKIHEGNQELKNMYDLEDELMFVDRQRSLQEKSGNTFDQGHVKKLIQVSQNVRKIFPLIQKSSKQPILQKEGREIVGLFPDKKTKQEALQAIHQSAFYQRMIYRHFDKY